MNGGFEPLDGFLNPDDYESVVNNMRLVNGKLWPIPITLDISEDFKNKVKISDRIILVDGFKNKLAFLTITSIYCPNKEIEALKVFGSLDNLHPSVNYLLKHTKEYYIGGKVTKIMDPVHTSFIQLRKTPQEIRQYIKDNNIENLVGFQTRNPMHKSHYTMTKLAIEKIKNSHLLIHPVVGMTKFGDIDYPVRVKCYQKVLDKYNDRASLSLLPLAMRMAGPREALWHALIRKNYGCTHFIVGRDHAGPGKNKDGVDFYEPYAAQELCKEYENELGIQILTFNEIGYVREMEQYVELNDSNIEMIKSNNYNILNISGTQFRHKINNNEEIPEWFAFPEVVDLLRKKEGLVIFMTGLSGAGKSTIAYYLQERLLELTNNKITILDGDEIRENLSKGLGFSKEDRDTNIKRIGYVASLISKHGGICIVPCIAPYEETRKYFRSLCEKQGRFIEIYVSTPLNVCEERDVKGLYKDVRAGKIKNFTGVDDPYEVPVSSDIIIDTTNKTLPETVNYIIENIKIRNYLSP
jgi:sulfate adenylyltransferase